MTDLVERLRDALSELYAIVNGECPSILDEDRGGCARLDLEIEELLYGEAATALEAQTKEIEALREEKTILLDDNHQAHLESSRYLERSLAQAKELEALRAERDQWDRRVAYDELKAREYENRATQQGQIDALTIRAETAERERDSYEKLYNDEVVARLRAERERAKEIEFIAIWSHDGSLQTFEDRERFRRAARAITGKD